MKLLGAVFVALLGIGPVFAQFGNVAFPAGRAFRGGNPWGNVVFPAVPGGAAAITGVRTGFGNRNGFHSGFGNRYGGGAGIYAYPIYVGGYGYGDNSGYAPAPPAAPPDNGGASAPAAPPVVINQYFGATPQDQGAPPPDTSGSSFQLHQPPPSDNATSGTADQSYYLIAFKDHTIYSAVAFYTEGDTLHYFTSGNVHNQVSLSLVDGPLTEKLNRDRNVEVHLTQ